LVQPPTPPNGFHHLRPNGQDIPHTADNFIGCARAVLIAAPADLIAVLAQGDDSSHRIEVMDHALMACAIHHPASEAPRASSVHRSTQRHCFVASRHALELGAPCSFHFWLGHRLPSMPYVAKNRASVCNHSLIIRARCSRSFRPSICHLVRLDTQCFLDYLGSAIAVVCS
jgi:hypothetical protein